jgi:N-acetylglucosamine-6-phosphate deacetylase
MTTQAFRNADVLVDGHLEPVDVVVSDGRIVEIADRPERVGPGDVDLDGLVLAPGFIDLQCNGAVGVDITSEPHRLAEVALALPRFGVTAFLPTVVTSPPTQRAGALDAIRAARTTPVPGAAVQLGLHLEGPLLSPQRLGAHPPQFVVGAADLDAEVDEWIRSGKVTLVTLAPELDGAPALVARLAAAGIVVAAGHTTMSTAEFAAAKAVGLRYVTHLFNAMAGFDHREPGPIGAALADDDVVVGLICDGVHVDPIAVAMAWKALGPSRTSLVSDAVAALGEPFGRLRLGAIEVIHDEHGVRTLDGVLAGSALALDQAVRNLMAFTGCSLADAVGTVTSVPAGLLGLADRGRIAVGARADFTVLDHDAGLVATIVAGAVAHGRLQP